MPSNPSAAACRMAMACTLALAIATYADEAPGVPQLEELGGEWQDAGLVGSMPAIECPLGGGKTVPKEVLAFDRVSFPPLTMVGSCGALTIDGTSPHLGRVRWYPDRVEREGDAGDITLRSSVRLMEGTPGVLATLFLHNGAAASRHVVVGISLYGSFSSHKAWGWYIPRDEPDGPARAMFKAGELVLSRAAGGVESCFAFSTAPESLTTSGAHGQAVWTIDLTSGAEREISFALAVGVHSPTVASQAQSWAKDPAATAAAAHHAWQTRFHAMFTLGNPVFSGALPVLQCDDPALARVYYMSAISLLSVLRTSLPLAPRVYVTNAPEANGIMMYYWDTRESATAFALLDPLMLRRYLEGWLAKGADHGYAQEFLSGTMQGEWYSANALSLFVLVDSYLNVTGDRAFLTQEIAGKRVLDHLDDLATGWQRLVRPGRTLANYGNARNLLECVPTYIDEVPSFNAGAIWMMRRVAALHEAAGEKDRAGTLRALAQRLLPAVLALYEPGQGVWDSLHADGTRVQMRHVFDFATLGLTIPEDLTPTMRSEMIAFVERELIVDHWMRAQSLRDPAAANSDRPDHGPMGAFSAWPAETSQVMYRFGACDQALDLLHRCARATSEGPFSQSRELLGTTKDARVRIAERGEQVYNAACGGAFLETVICGCFGFRPDILSGGDAALLPEHGSRGFTGSLRGLRCAQGTIAITSDATGLHVSPSP